MERPLNMKDANFKLENLEKKVIMVYFSLHVSIVHIKIDFVSEFYGKKNRDLFRFPSQ